MKKLLQLTRTLLVALCLLGGANSAWGEATTAFTQDFTDKSSTDPSVYGFALSYGSGSSAEKVTYTVTDGVLKCDANAGEAKSRTGLALATFSEISSTNIVTVSYKWQITGAYSNANTETYIGNASGNALDIFWEPTGGATSQGCLKINGNNAFDANDQRALRGSTYTITATLNLYTKKVTSLIMTNSASSTWNYTLSSEMDFAADINTIDRFGFSNLTKTTYTQTTSLDDLLIKYEKLTVATPTFTIGSYNYEQGGYAVTPSCATDGATLTYTIGGGAATACTSGVPFYAKGGKLNITASKTGWTSSSLADDNQWTLNSAPSTTSPETLIAFQTSSDNGDKNIEHVYKSVTIAGGANGAIAGIVSGDANGLKLRTNQSSNTITLNVNSGYTVTRVSIAAKSNNKEATIGLTSTTVDGGSNIMAATTTFPISTAASAETYDTNGTEINANNNIVFTFDNSAIDGSNNKKNNQILATIKVWYKTPVENAIADCKTYETSSAFATAIDAGSFSTVAEVYAFHSAWQIAKANENGSTDYSKAIMNRTFELHNTNGWTIYGDAASTELDDNKYGVVEYGEGWSQYYTGYNGRNVSQTIAGLPAGTYTLTAKVYSWGEGAPVRLFANGQLSDAENGIDHDPVLVFTVAGNEPSIKIGIGGVGNNNNTDNTWGTWGYRVKNFTLTRTAVSTKISSLGWSTFSSAYALDFENADDGIEAYMITGYEGTTVTTSKVTGTIPAETGLLLKGTPSTSYNIPVVASSETITSGNKLVACLTETTVSKGTGTNVNYVLAANGETAEFQWINETNATVGAGKAYLTLEGGPTPAQGAPGLTIDIFNDMTGIDEVRGQKEGVKGAYYNLAGQRVAQPTKGLYIVNGKKVVIK